VLAAAVPCVIGLVWRLMRMPAERRGRYVWFAGGAIVTVVLLLPLDLVSQPVVHGILQLAAVVSIPVGALVAIVRHKA
jgi:hypothetical protein